MAKTRLVKGGSGVSVVVSGKDKGVLRIAQTLVDDIRRIADPVRGSVRVIQSESVFTPGWANSSVLIVAGILGESSSYDECAAAYKKECAAIKGKRECYLIKFAKKSKAFSGKDVIFVFERCGLFIEKTVVRGKSRQKRQRRASGQDIVRPVTDRSVRRHICLFRHDMISSFPADSIRQQHFITSERF